MGVRVFVFFILVHWSAATLGAQARSDAFVDLTVGTNLSIGTVPLDHHSYGGGFTYVLVSFGNQPDASRPLVAALHVGLNVVMGTDAGCGPAPLGCSREFPFGPLIAITVGARPVRSLFELTAGPALIGVNPSGMSFGVMAAGRIGVPPGRYLSPGLAIHVLAAPADGAIVVATGLGFSLRTW